MIDGDCEEWRLQVQAEVDGELSVAESAALERHVAGCAACEALRQQLIELSGAIRAGVGRETVPDRLRNALQARLVAASAPDEAPVRMWPAQPSGRARTLRRLWPGAVTFAAGAVIAASVMLVMLPRPDAGHGGVEGDIVTGHIRALQPGHLMDVISSDRHTVKPWFDGRIDYAPPVKDLAKDGFPLLGGRLDYIGGRPVAALAYGRRQHIIDLYVWPAGAAPTAGGDATVDTRNGYNVLGWTSGGMTAWAVSDLGADELAQFVQLWRAAT